MKIIEKIKSEFLLPIIIKWHPNESKKRKALSQIKNQSRIAKIVSQASSVSVRSLALEFLTDLSMLLEITKKNSQNTIRDKAKLLYGCEKHSNTLSMVFESDTTAQQRTKGRIGVCENCFEKIELNGAVEYIDNWDRHYAYFYFCPNCNPHPDPKRTFYHGRVVGKNTKEIVDQVEYGRDTPY